MLNVGDKVKFNESAKKFSWYDKEAREILSFNQVKNTVAIYPGVMVNGILNTQVNIRYIKLQFDLKDFEIFYEQELFY